MSNMKLTVRMITGEEYKMSVPSDCSIRRLKKKLAREVTQKTTWDRIQLIDTGKVLKDHLSLADYNIRNGAKIHALIAYRQGAKD